MNVCGKRLLVSDLEAMRAMTGGDDPIAVADLCDAEYTRIAERMQPPAGKWTGVMEA